MTEDLEVATEKVETLQVKNPESGEEIVAESENAVIPQKKKKNKKKNKNKKSGQCVADAFPDHQFPKGEFILSSKMHACEDDLKKLSADNNDLYYERLNSIRHAAEVHRRVRCEMRDKMKAGVDLAKFCEELEENVYKLVKEDGCRANMAFPTGVSVNECAAHYTPDIEESCIVQDGDIVKIDFGVHVNGHLVDSAFTVNLNPKIENLRLATIAATNEGLKLAGPDAYISDITERIYETITSYEVQDSNGNILPVKCIENLNGHQIEPYIIHAGKTIPLVKGSHNKPGRMEVGEQYAIETFASINGNGHVNERGQSTHFMIAPGMLNSRPKMDSVNQLLKHIRENHSSLAFCQRFIHRKYKAFSKSKLNWCLNNLVTNNILNDYPPLCDKKGSMTSQMEHTLFVKENGAEIVTRGSDY